MRRLNGHWPVESAPTRRREILLAFIAPHHVNEFRPLALFISAVARRDFKVRGFGGVALGSFDFIHIYSGDNSICLNVIVATLFSAKSTFKPTGSRTSSAHFLIAARSSSGERQITSVLVMLRVTPLDLSFGS